MPSVNELGVFGEAPASSDTALRAAINIAKTDLFVTLTRSGNELAPKVATLNLATAQRLVLADIQQRIAKFAHDIVTGLDENQIRIDLLDLGIELADYCKPK